ncbi:fibrinogen-related protein J1 precursor [Biomphalaria glabrata]|nr:fibrinogen-related protein J1 precursor [Biomphalaria glabrata]
MTLLLHFALYLLFFSFSTSELVIDVQPNVITPEVTQHIVVNCSVTRNQVPTLDVIKSLTLSRYNEKLKEFEALLALEAKTLNLKQLVQFPRSQISFGNLYVTLSLQSPTQSDARVYRCKVEGDNANGTSLSLVAKQEVEYRTNTTALIEEILRLKSEEKNDKCPFKEDELTGIHQRLRLHFVGSSEIIKELIEPLTLTCSLQGFQYDENQNVTVQFMYILHETNGVVATINKGQPVVTTIQENNSKNVKGELSENDLKDSYIQVTWRNLKSSESGKYFCGAHITDSNGKSKKLNEMLIVTIATATFDDLVKVIQKLMKQADEDKEKIQENKQKIKNIQEDFDTRQQNLSPFKDILVNGENDYKEMNNSNSILPDRPCNVNSTKQRLVSKLASGLKVMCDTMTDGGGWIIIQRRMNGMVDFNRDWQEYRDGFGDYDLGEFYLGNENIYKLTSTGKYELRIDLKNSYAYYYALYSQFQIMNESNKYKLNIGGYLGNATDSFSRHDNMNFSTFKDDKNAIKKCVLKYPGPGGWWFSENHGSNLNETNGVVATINKGQPVVTTIQENNSKNVKGELSENDLKDSYIQVTWRNLKSSESGKYFCGAHIIDSNGKSEKLNEMLIVTIATATFDDLVKVIQKLMKQADEDKEKIQENKQKIKNIQEDFDTRQQNLSPFKDILVNGKKDYKEMNTSDSILPDRPCNVNSTKRRLVLNLASGLKVMCDTMTDGGGWIIIQRRMKGMVDFNRDWQEYRDGFGDYNIGEFYLGNENIYKLTSTGKYELRVDLEINYSFYYALYSKFQIMNESNKYKLKISGYLGNATDSLSWHDNLNFSTYKDNKNNIPNCLFKYPGPGGWWFGAGHGSNLNGVWRSDRFNQGINWYGLTGYKKSAYFSEMKIREKY